MKLSIIVPVYKAENFLEQNLAALTHQNMDDYEVILVNDGSPDKSGEIMQHCAEKHPDMVRCINMEKNEGQGKARNLGLDVAQGDYVGFVDSDDWVALDMFTRMYEAAVRENADICICDFFSVASDGSGHREPARYEVNNPLGAAGSACNKIFRRSLIGDIRFPEKLWYEDFAFSAKLLLLSKKNVYIPEPLYFYRSSQESTMRNNNSARNLEIIEIMEDIHAFMREQGSDEGFDYLLINHVLLDSINRVAAQKGKDKKQVIKKLRAYVHEQLPKLSECESFNAETKNRRTIMKLNYMGHFGLSGLLLKVKKGISR